MMDDQRLVTVTLPACDLLEMAQLLFDLQGGQELAQELFDELAVFLYG